MKDTAAKKAQAAKPATKRKAAARKPKKGAAAGTKSQASSSRNKPAVKKAIARPRRSRAAKPARAPYMSPTILPHARTIGNSFGAAPARRIFTEVDGADVEELVQRYGSPLFVYSEKGMRARARELIKAFSGYPRVCFAWSYKTNHLDAICALFHQEGWYAEVVSAAEYEMARRMMPGNRIIFNGAYKPVEACRTALDEGALVQIDHFDEIPVLESVAGKGKPPPVGIRINMNLRQTSTWQRFGFSLERGEALAAVRRIVRGGTLSLVGLHCHIGTYVLNPEAYRDAARKLVAFAALVQKETGKPIEVLNLGGGFPSHSSLGSVYGAAEDVVPPLADYGQAITEELASCALQSKPPLLVLESGRALVDDAGSLIATVAATRQLPTGERGLVLDAGVNLLYTSTWYKHEILPTTRVEGSLVPTKLLGPLCMAIDIVRSKVNLPPLEPGHRVSIRPVGAYNVTQWMQFSQMRPAVVMVAEDGSVDVIRIAESVDYLKSVERLPERLRPPAVEGTILPQRSPARRSGKGKKAKGAAKSRKAPRRPS